MSNQTKHRQQLAFWRIYIRFHKKMEENDKINMEGNINKIKMEENIKIRRRRRGTLDSLQYLKMALINCRQNRMRLQKQKVKFSKLFISNYIWLILNKQIKILKLVAFLNFSINSHLAFLIKRKLFGTTTLLIKRPEGSINQAYPSSF